MPSDYDRMRQWCIEKATNVVQALAWTIDAINHLPERPMQDENGWPTADGIIVGNVYDMLTDATKLLSYHVGAEWNPSDAQAIIKEGTAGYARVAARYGLVLPPPSANMADDDPRRLVMKTAWIFYQEDAGWGWMYFPPLRMNSFERHAVRRGFDTQQAARESALQLGYLAAPIPPSQEPMDLGPITRYIEGNTYSLEQIAAFNKGNLTEEAMTPIPDGAQVLLIGTDGPYPVVRYQNQEITLSADAVLREQRRQSGTSAFQFLIWEDMAPIVARDMERIEREGYADWRFETFDLGRPILETCEWNGAVFDPDQQREALITALEAAKAYAARLPHGECLALCGSVGSGKSHLAIAIALEAAQKGFTAGYIGSSQLPYQWKPSHLQALQAYRNIDLLVLDDFFFGEHRSTKLAGPISELITQRQENDRATIITSALPLDKLPDLVRENAVSVQLPISDYRVIPFHKRHSTGSDET